MEKTNVKRVALVGPPIMSTVVSMALGGQSSSANYVFSLKPDNPPRFQGREVITSAKGNMYPAAKTRRK